MYKGKKIIGLIPARLASSRLPGKLLMKIGEHSIIKRVYFQCKKAKLLDHVAIITDHEEILTHAKSFGADVRLSNTVHTSGTDRIGEAASFYDTMDFIINVQGDEPFISPLSVDGLIKTVVDRNVEIGTPVCKFENDAQVENSNIVKVVRTIDNFAMYFSRAIIPFQRDSNSDFPYQNYWRHVGLYAFRRDVLLKLIQLKPTELEQCEKLEQLRWLENGYRILTVEQEHPYPGIDTMEDYVHASQFAALHNL